MSALGTVVSKVAFRLVAHRFVAGEHMEDALAKVQQLNAEGFVATVNVLGEYAADETTVKRYSSEYVRLILGISKGGLQASISVKLTQLGLCIDEYLCARKLRLIVLMASTHNVFVEIDRESPIFSEATKRLFEKEAVGFPNRIRQCVQMNHAEGELEAEAWIEGGHAVRICKGAYKGPYRGTDLTDLFWEFAEHASAILPLATPYRDPVCKSVGLCENTTDRYAPVAFATHDRKILRRLSELYGDQKWFEFQMLLGFSRRQAEQLRDSGYIVRIYVPYGPDWFAYGRRRWHQIGRMLFRF